MQKNPTAHLTSLQKESIMFCYFIVQRFPPLQGLMFFSAIKMVRFTLTVAIIIITTQTVYIYLMKEIPTFPKEGNF